MNAQELPVSASNIKERVASWRQQGLSEREIASRLDIEFRHQLDESDRRLEAIRKQFSEATRRPEVAPWIKRWRVPVVVLLFAVLGGVLLYFTLGEQLVFAHADAYWNITRPVAIAGGLAIAFLAGTSRMWHQHMAAQQMPTRWVRYLLGAPLTGAMAAWFCAIAPIGWAAFIVRVTGAPIEGVTAQALEVQPDRGGRKGCDFTGTFQVDGTRARLCVSAIARDHHPRPGSQVLLDGLQNPLGLYVQVIRLAPSSGTSNRP